MRLTAPWAIYFYWHRFTALQLWSAARHQAQKEKRMKIPLPPRALFLGCIFRVGDQSRRKLWPCCIGFIRAPQHSGPRFARCGRTAAQLSQPLVFLRPERLCILTRPYFRSCFPIFLNLDGEKQFLPSHLSPSPALSPGCRTTGNGENWRGCSDHLQHLSQLSRAEDAYCHALESGDRQTHTHVHSSK